MAINTAPMLYKRLYNSMAGGGAQTACTTRAPTATASLAGANILILVPTTGNTDGRRIERIRIKASSTSFTSASAAQTVTIWRHDGTTAYPLFELQLSAKTPSTTVISFEQEYPCDVRLSSTEALYFSCSVTTSASTTAFVVHAEGGDY
jgi:uncharacterized protein (DUF2252 family)